MKTIHEIFEYCEDLFLRKTADYGSAWKKQPLLAPELTPEQALRTRLSDKIQRLATLLKNGNPEVVSESIDDTIIDTINYLAMWLILRNTA